MKIQFMNTQHMFRTAWPNNYTKEGTKYSPSYLPYEIFQIVSSSENNNYFRLVFISMPGMKTIKLNKPLKEMIVNSYERYH